MVLTFIPSCRNCGGSGWHRPSDPAGNIPSERCHCNPAPTKPPITRIEALEAVKAAQQSLKEALAALDATSRTPTT